MQKLLYKNGVRGVTTKSRGYASLHLSRLGSAHGLNPGAETVPTLALRVRSRYTRVILVPPKVNAETIIPLHGHESRSTHDKARRTSVPPTAALT